MEWIRNWLLMCPLEHDIEVVKILKSHIGKWKRIWLYMLMGWTLGWALDMCGLGHLVQIIIIIFIILFFELVSLYTVVISKIVCLFSNVYFKIPHSWKTTFEKLFQRENILCIHLSQRKRKRHRVVHRARTLCASSPCCRSFYLGKQTSMSLKASQIVWEAKSTLRRLCPTQDLICVIHPSCIWSVSF